MHKLFNIALKLTTIEMDLPVDLNYNFKCSSFG